MVFDNKNKDGPLLDIGNASQEELNNFVKQDGKSLLHHAVTTGNIKLLNSLLKDDNKINKVDENGQTLLHYAVSLGNAEVVKLLADKIDPNIQDKKGRTALHYASILGDKHMVESLLPHTDPNKRDNDGRTALHYSVARDGGKLFFKKYLNNNALFEKQKINFDDKSMVSRMLLADKRIKIYKEDKDNSTALETAINTGNVDVVNKLVKLGADLEKTSKSKTPLMLAVEAYNNSETPEKKSKNMAIIKTLVENGANPEKTSGELFSYKAPISLAEGEARKYLDEVVSTTQKLHSIKREHSNDESKLAKAMSEFRHLENSDKLIDMLKKSDSHSDVIRVASNLTKERSQSGHGI